MTAVILESSEGIISTIAEPGKTNEIAAYVIEGTLELDVAGEKELLEAGDCAVLNISGLVMATARKGFTCRALIVKAG
jgi:hypothetical protein